MRGNVNDLESTLDNDDVSIKGANYGDMSVGMVSISTEMDMTPLFKGLPGDRCQTPHWGYLLKGRIHMTYSDREETYEAGDTYYMEPGHTLVIEAGTEFVEFSPREDMERTMEVIGKNLQELQGQE